MRRLFNDLGWVFVTLSVVTITCYLFFVVNREIHVFRAGSLDDASKYRLTRAIIDARNWGTNFAEWDWAEWYVVDLDHDGFVLSISAGADCVFGTADDYCVRVCTIGV